MKNNYKFISKNKELFINIRNNTIRHSNYDKSSDFFLNDIISIETTKKPKKIKSLFLGFIGIISIPILFQIIFNPIIAYSFSIVVLLASIFLLVNHFKKLKTLLLTFHTNNPKVFIRVALNEKEIKEIKEIINNVKNLHPMGKSPVPLRNKLNLKV